MSEHTSKTVKSAKSTKDVKKVKQLTHKNGDYKAMHTLCISLIDPYLRKGKDGAVIDFMCRTMIDPATSWFEIVEMPVVQCSVASAARDTKGPKGKRHLIKDHILTNLEI
jgi:hypothetical protein